MMKTTNAMQAPVIDTNALFKIGAGLYVVTAHDGQKHNGMICNTVFQVTNTPNRVAVCINQQNYSCGIIRKSGILNVNILSEDAPFKFFQNFGFQSGRNADKFADIPFQCTENGLAMLSSGINAVLSLKVEQVIDLDTHCLFIGAVTEAAVLSDLPTMTYDYYQNHVKPKPQAVKKTGWVCQICGHIYDGELLPADYICPICGRGADAFKPL